jgi:hypothetical protein
MTTPRTGLYGLVTSDMVGPAVSEGYGQVIDGHEGALTVVLDNARETRDSIETDRKLTAEGKQAKRREHFRAAISSLDGLLARHRASIDAAIAKAKEGLPAGVVRPAGDLLNDPFQREVAAGLVLENFRWLRGLPSGMAAVELESWGSRGDRMLFAAASSLTNAERERFLGISVEEWARLSRVYAEALAPESFAAVGVAEDALNVLVGNDGTAKRALEDLFGPGVELTPASPVSMGNRPTRVG